MKAPIKTTIHELEVLGRQLGKPRRELLEPLIEAAPEPAEDALEQVNVAEFVLDAGSICHAAHGGYQRCSLQQRVIIRGFSLDLLLLAVDQVLRLDRAFRDYQQFKAEMADARDKLVVALSRGRLLCDWARSLALKVAGPQGGTFQPGAAPVHNPGPDESVATALLAVAEHAQALLRDGSPGVRSRSALLSFDETYIQGLTAAALELTELERRASDSGTLAKKQAETAHSLATAQLLIGLIKDAFDSACRMDPTLRPVLTLPSAQDAGKVSGHERASQVMPAARPASAAREASPQPLGSGRWAIQKR